MLPPALTSRAPVQLLLACAACLLLASMVHAQFRECMSQDAIARCCSLPRCSFPPAAFCAVSVYTPSATSGMQTLGRQINVVTDLDTGAAQFCTVLIHHVVKARGTLTSYTFHSLNTQNSILQIFRFAADTARWKVISSQSFTTAGTGTQTINIATPIPVESGDAVGICAQNTSPVAFVNQALQSTIGNTAETQIQTISANSLTVGAAPTTFSQYRREYSFQILHQRQAPLQCDMTKLGSVQTFGFMTRTQSITDTGGPWEVILPYAISVSGVVVGFTTNHQNTGSFKLRTFRFLSTLR